jgi:O-antigen ligase
VSARATTISIAGEPRSYAAAGSGLRAAIAYGLSATLMFSALALGGTPEWAQFGLRMAAIVLLLGWMALQWQTGAVKLHRNPAYLAALAFAGLIAWQLVFRTTVYRYATWTEACGYWAYGILFFLAAELLSNRRLAVFVRTLAGFGAAVAFLALMQYLSGTPAIYWRYSPQFHSQIFGPFANHNHYAGLMEMLWPAALVVGMREHGGRRALWIAAAALMIASIVLSASRGGTVSCLAQIVLVIIVLSGSRARRTATLIWSFAVLLAIGASVLWLATPETLARLINTDGAQRTLIYHDSVRMWLQRPWTGFGLGTFPVAYPRYRSFYSVFLINQAHNDYLQLLVECGIAGFACIAGFLGLTLRQGVRAVNQLGLRDANAAARVAAMLGIAGILVHSLVDFNLHIPSNAALFAVLCGIVSRPVDLARSWPGRRVPANLPIAAGTGGSAY